MMMMPPTHPIAIPSPNNPHDDYDDDVDNDDDHHDARSPPPPNLQSINQSINQVTKQASKQASNQASNQSMEHPGRWGYTGHGDARLLEQISINVFMDHYI